MSYELDRDALKTACSWHGGIRATARLISVDDGNLSKWLRGHQTLSDENVAKLLSALGLPNGEADASRVHTWFTRRHSLNLSAALSLYFPNGAEIALAPWVDIGFQNITEAFKKGPHANSVHCIFDGHMRAVLHMPSGMMLQRATFGKSFNWKDGHRRNAAIDIPENNETWLSNSPSIEEFDRAWNNENVEITADDVLHAIIDEGISYSVAIERIRGSKDEN